MLGHGELAFVVVVPGGGDFNGVVTAGEGGHVDGAAAGLGVSDDGVPPVVVDGDIVSDIGVVNNGDHAQLTVVIDVRHIGRDVPLRWWVVGRMKNNISITSCCTQANCAKCKIKE